MQSALPPWLSLTMSRGVSPATRQATQIYVDALNAAIQGVATSGGLKPFINALGWAVEERGLCNSDGAGIYSTKPSHEAFLKIVEADLARIHKVGEGY